MDTLRGESFYGRFFLLSPCRLLRDSFCRVPGFRVWCLSWYQIVGTSDNSTMANGSTVTTTATNAVVICDGMESESFQPIEAWYLSLSVSWLSFSQGSSDSAVIKVKSAGSQSAYSYCRTYGHFLHEPIKV